MYFDSGKVGCVFLMVAVPMLPHAEFGQTDHGEDASHFTIVQIHRLSSINIFYLAIIIQHSNICMVKFN